MEMEVWVRESLVKEARALVNRDKKFRQFIDQLHRDIEEEERELEARKDELDAEFEAEKKLVKQMGFYSCFDNRIYKEEEA